MPARRSKTRLRASSKSALSARQHLDPLRLAARAMTRRAQGQLVRTTKGQWITQPSRCPHGHVLGPNQVLFGRQACLGHGGGYTHGLAAHAMRRCTGHRSTPRREDGLRYVYECLDLRLGLKNYCRLKVGCVPGCRMGDRDKLARLTIASSTDVSCGPSAHLAPG
jgi:hypothetical protein